MSSQELEEGEIKEDSVDSSFSNNEDCTVQGSTLDLGLGSPNTATGTGRVLLTGNTVFNGGKCDTNCNNSNTKNRARSPSNDSTCLFIPQSNASLIPVLPFLDRDERLQNIAMLSQIPGPVFKPDFKAPSDTQVHNVLPLHIPPLVRAPLISGTGGGGITRNLAFSSSAKMPQNVGQLNDVDLRFDNIPVRHNQWLDRKNHVTSFRIKHSTLRSLPKPAPVFNVTSPNPRLSHPPLRSPGSRYSRGNRKLSVEYQGSNPRNRASLKESRVLIESVDKDASYEVLLEQYKRIRLELSHLKTEENAQIRKNTPSKVRKPNEKECRHRRKSKSPRAGGPSHPQPRKVKGKSKSPGSGHVSQNKQSESLKPCIINEIPLPLPENIPEIEIGSDDDDDDDEIMELRRKALESRAQQAAKENRERDEKASAQLESQLYQCPVDNYEPVDMDLCSDVPETQVTDLSEMEMDTEDNESEKDEEDLERLREQLLKGLKSKKVVKPPDSSAEASLDLVQKENLPEIIRKENPSIVKENKESAPEVVVKDRAPLEETSQRIVPSKATVPDIPYNFPIKHNANLIVIQPKANKCQKLVINLQDDSSSEEESNEQDGDVEKQTHFVSILDSFLKEAKAKTELAITPSPRPLPTAVPQLSKAQQIEYRKLKEELTRRDLASNKNKLAVTKQKEIINSAPSDVAALLIKKREEAATTENKQKQVHLASCEEKLSNERANLTAEGHRVTVLNQALLKKNQMVLTEELKIKQLKQQLTMAEKNLATTKESLQTLQGLVTGVQKSVSKRKSTIFDLEKECLVIGKDLIGLTYKVPTTIGKVNVRRKSISISNSTNLKKGKADGKVLVKRSQSKFEAERERLQKLEKELAQRLQELKSKSLGIKNSKPESPKQTLTGSPVHVLVQFNKTIGKVFPATQNAALNETKKIDFRSKTFPLQNGSFSSQSVQISLEKLPTVDLGGSNTLLNTLPRVILNHDSTRDHINTFNANNKQISTSIPIEKTTLNVPNPVKSSHVDLPQNHSDEYAHASNINTRNSAGSIELQAFDNSKSRKKRKRGNSGSKPDRFVRTSSKNAKKQKITDSELPAIENTSSTIGFPYESCLYHLKSYRLSPYCQIEGYSNTYINKINPREYICKYNVSGTCNDDECAFQHIRENFKHVELLCDIVSYCPELAGVCGNDDQVIAREKLVSFCQKMKKKIKNVSQSEIRLQQMYKAILLEISLKLKLEGPYFASKVLARKYLLNFFSSPKKKVVKPLTPVVLDGQKIALQRRNQFWNQSDAVAYDRYNDNDKRYFEIEEKEDSTELEKMVDEEPNNIELWLNLAKFYMNQANENNNNRLNKALDTMSRALEANQEDNRLWQYYLTLYALHPDSAVDIESMFEQALDYVNSYVIRWRYFEITTSFTMKTKICVDILNHLASEGSNFVVAQPQRSHHFLEILFNLVQLQLLANKSDQALEFLKISLNQTVAQNSIDILSKTSSVEENLFFKPFLNQLTTRDKVLLWLVYIYFMLFQNLPPLLLEQGTTYLGRFVLKEPFLICWPCGEEILIESSKLLKIAIESCLVDKSLETYNDCVILYSNLARLQLTLKNEMDPVLKLNKTLEDCPKLEKMWIVLSNCYGMQGAIIEAENTLKTALMHLPNSMRLLETIATFYLQTNQKTLAFTILQESVKNYFVLDESNESLDCKYMFQVLLNHFPSDDPTPIVSLERKPNLNFSDEDKSYLWVCYVTILQCKNRSFGEIKEAFESAMLSVKTIDSKKFVLEHYFQVTLSFTTSDVEPRKLIHRCFQTIPTLRESESDSLEKYHDYAFHNGLIDSLCQSFNDVAMEAEVLQEFLTATPDNLQLLKRLVTCLTELGETTRCFNLLSSFLEVTSGIPELWIIYTTMALGNSTEQEVHTLYSKALGLFPMSVELWRHYIDYEKSQDHETHVDAALQKFIGLKLSLP